MPCSSDLSISKLESAIDVGLLWVWKVERPPNHLGTFFFFIFLLGVFLQLLKPNIPSFKQHQRSHRNVLCFSINNFLLPTSFGAPQPVMVKDPRKVRGFVFFVKPFLPVQKRIDTSWQFRSEQRKEKHQVSVTCLTLPHNNPRISQPLLALPGLRTAREKPRWSPTQILSEVGPQSQEISAPNTHHLQTPTLGPDSSKPPNKQLLGWGLVAQA